MAIALTTPKVEDLGAALDALSEWQTNDSPFQLHPGDLGWFARFGSHALAAALRTWNQDGRILAIGLLDEPDLLRLTLAPDVIQNEELARQLVSDLSDPARGVFAAGEAFLETPMGIRVRELMIDVGWDTDEPWVSLQRDLSEPVEAHGLSVEVVDSTTAQQRVDIQRASFAKSTYTVERWNSVTGGPAFTNARDLIGYDSAGAPVAGITVWSAGPGRPGLIEPMGVVPDHRGHGYGRSITLAGASALRELGASSAVVATEGHNKAAIATYRAAGFSLRTELFDLSRPYVPA